MMAKGRSVPFTIVMASISVALSLALVVGWVLVIVRNRDFATEAFAANIWLLVSGIVSFIVIMTVLMLFTVFLVREIREVRRQTSFIDSVTHELKSPLASLKLCAETLARPELEGSRREELRMMMLEDVRRLLGVIDGILEASRVGHRAERRPAQKIDLSELMNQLVAVLHRNYRLADDAVQITIEEGVELVADEQALRTVLGNLLDNAAKYSGPDPKIEVRVRNDGAKRVIVEVQDNGIGIEKKELRRIFQRFYRVEGEAVRSRYGTGLGLFVVSAWVRSMNGEIEAHSAGRGQGTTFRIALPMKVAK